MTLFPSGILSIFGVGVAAAYGAWRMGKFPAPAGDVRYSRNFLRSEWLRSATASARGIANVPTDVHDAAMRAHTNAIMQPVRDKFGKVNVTSGYRSSALNAVIPGASSTSQHSRGEAVDFNVPGMSNAELMGKLWAMARDEGLPVDQAILYTNTGHVHVSHTTRRPNRGQWLVGPTGGPYSRWSP
jgi:zinc D-Ala-D-Ala carboxypeptidase